MSLVVISTHPIQYHAPVYRCLQQQCGVDVTVIYGSDHSVAGYQDKEFGAAFAWDTDLLSGYKSVFLNRVKSNTPFDPDKISCRGLEAAMDEARPTAVLILGYAVKLYQRAWFHAQRQQYPVMFRMDVDDILYKTFFLKVYTKTAVLRWLYSQSDAFLYFGKASLRHYERLGVPLQKLFYSPYIVDSVSFNTDERFREKIRLSERLKFGLNNDDLVILFSGKLIERKDPMIILRAIRSLPIEIQKKIAVLYLGDGPLKPLLSLEGNKNIFSRIVFCGFQNQTKLSHFYHCADFLILPSYKDQWGLVVNEALVHGLPCILSDRVSSHHDLIEAAGTGEVFKVGDEEDLVCAILRLLKYINNSDVRQRCREKVSGHTVKAAAQGIAKAYHAITSDRKFYA